MILNTKVYYQWSVNRCLTWGLKLRLTDCFLKCSVSTIKVTRGYSFSSIARMLGLLCYLTHIWLNEMHTQSKKWEKTEHLFFKKRKKCCLPSWSNSNFKHIFIIFGAKETISEMTGEIPKRPNLVFFFFFKDSIFQTLQGERSDMHKRLGREKKICFHSHLSPFLISIREKGLKIFL